MCKLVLLSSVLMLLNSVSSVVEIIYFLEEFVLL